MGMKLDWGNTVNQFMRSVNRTTKDFERDLSIAIRMTVDEVLNRVRKATPVESGRLRQSWKKSRIGRKSYKYLIENNVMYASFIENGSRHVVPVKMLRNAMEYGRGRLKRRLRLLKQKYNRDL